MQDELRALAKLAEIDNSAREYDDELKELPAHLNSLRKDLETLEALLDAERSQLEEAKALRDRRTEELKERSEALSRARSRTGQATNVRDLGALERDVEAARRNLKEHEDELKLLEETIAQKEAVLAERSAQLDEARAAFKAEEESGEARIRELTQLRESVAGGRDELVRKISVPLYRRYERLRDRLRTGVTFVDSDNCAACHRAFPTQQLVTLQRGDEVVECQFCHRIAIHVSFREQ